MAPKSKFKAGEKVLCFHESLLYEAKCLKSGIREKVMKYFIHYSRWSKAWDEWVSECRVLKYNEINLQKQKELEKNYVKTKKSTAACRTLIKKEIEEDSVQSTAPRKPRKAKAKKVFVSGPTCQQIAEIKAEVAAICTHKISQPIKKEVSNEHCFDEETKMEVDKLVMPNLLKEWLIEDLSLITRRKMLLSLPARVSVEQIVIDFTRHILSNDAISQPEKETAIEIAEMIKEAFHIHVESILLSKFERKQYAEKLAEYKDRKLCQIYGTIHLLRMFNNLEGFIESVDAIIESVDASGDKSSLVEHLNDILQFISRNQNFFNEKDYITSEYHIGRRCG